MATQTPQRRRRLLRNWKFSMPKHPGLDYLMLRISIFVLVGIGVVMAFSATMTWSVIEGNTVWSQHDPRLRANLITSNANAGNEDQHGQNGCES